MYAEIKLINVFSMAFSVSGYTGFVQDCLGIGIIYHAQKNISPVYQCAHHSVRHLCRLSTLQQVHAYKIADVLFCFVSFC